MAFTAGEINIMIRAQDQASRTLGGISRQMGGLQRTVQRFGPIAGAALAGAGVAAVNFAMQFDDAANTIRRGTGATGEALEALKDDFRATFRDVPDSMADVATATADINTRLGLTGPPLQAMTRQFLDFARVAEIDVATAVAAGTRAFGDWSIATENQTEALDHVWRVAQTTGIGVDSLMQKVVQFGAPLRQFGYGFEEATVLLGAWEREGVNAEAILGALKIGVANFARENIDAVTGLQDFIAELTELGPGAEATARAIEIFGSRAGPDMAAAVTEGRFALGDLMAIIEGSEETIAAAAEETLSLGDRFRMLRNDALVQLEPVLNRVFDALERGMIFLSEHQGILIAAAAAIGTGLVIAFTAWAVSAAAAAVATIAATWPVLAIIVGIAALVVGITLLVTHWDDVTAATGRVIDIFRDVLTKVEEMPIIGEIFTTLKDVVTDQVQDIIDFVQGIIDIGTEVISFFTNVFSGDWDAAWQDVKDIAEDILGLFLDFLQLGFMDEIVTLLAGWIPDLWDQATATFTALKDAAIEKAGELLTWLGGLPESVFAAIGDVAGTLAGKGGAIIQGLWDGMVFAWGAVVSWLGELPGKAAEAFSTIGQAIREGIVSGINEALAWLHENVRISIPGFDPPGPGSIPGFDWSFPEIQFHQGGIVPGFPGEQVPALLQAGERVLPPISAGMPAAVGRSGEGEPVVIHQHFTIEDRSPAAIAHAVEMAGLELGQRLAAEGV